MDKWLEKRMVDITATEKNIGKKNEKKWRQYETSGTTLKAKHLHYQGPRRRRERESIWENIWKYSSWKLAKHGKGNRQPSRGSTENPRKDKPKEKHTETHSNQTDKN